MNKFLIIFSTCLTMGLTVHGQARLSPYTINALRLHTPTTRSGSDNTTIRAYINMGESANRTVLHKLGVKIDLDLGDIITARIPIKSIEELCKQKGVEYISIGNDVYPMMKDARQATGADDMMAGKGLSRPLDGSGVVIGIIDAGFDYTHPAFYDANRSTLRIKRVWEQATKATSIAGATTPKQFDYGMEFNSPEAILAAGTDKEGYSHGTHVAGIATGGDTANDNPYYGIAGKADIVLVSYGDLKESNVNISDAIAYIYDYAKSVDKPCVINMSLGTQMGPHDGTSPFDQVADRLQDKGRLLVGAAGNFGAVSLHTSTTGGTTVNTAINYAKAPSNSNVGGNVDIWGTKGQHFSVKLSVINKSTGQIVDQSEEYLIADNGGTYVFTPASPTRGNVMVSTEVNPFNGKPHALVTSGITSIRSSNLIGITVIPQGEGRVDLWADGSNITLTDGGLEGFSAGDTNYTLAEIGGTGKRIISVGAFVTSHATGQQFPNDAIGDIASFSSKGPTIDERMKPDITAPGSYIVSSLSSYATAVPGTTASSEVWNGRTYQYGYMEGTSMAAPFVTGVVAAWLQAYPSMSPEDLRKILGETATTDRFTLTSMTENGTWGYGKIDALSGARKALEMEANGIVNVSENLHEYSVSRNENGWVVSPITDLRTIKIELMNLAGKKLLTEIHHSVGAGEHVTIPDDQLPQGMYVLRISTSGYPHSFKVMK